MIEAGDIATLMETLGFPVLISLLAGGALWLVIKWMMKTLCDKLDSQHKMTIKLIDRVRAMDNDLIRLDVMIRLLRDMPPDYERLGKRNPEDARQD